MKKERISSCLFSSMSVGCFFIIAVIIFVFLAFVKGKGVDGVLKHKVVDIDENAVSNEHNEDTHLFPKNKNIRVKIAILSDSESDLKNINEALEKAKENGADMIIHLGDISQLGVLEDLDNIKVLFEESGLPYYATPGDRDLWAYLYGRYQTVNGFEKVFGKSYQVVEKNGNKFLIINNADEFEGIDDEQWEFIEKNIDDADFIFLHNPIEFDDSLLLSHKGMGQYDEGVEEQRKKLLDMVKKSNVKAVFGGDQHRFTEYKDKEKNNLFYYVIGALNSERNLEDPSFAVLTIYDDGDYYVKKVKLD